MDFNTLYVDFIKENNGLIQLLTSELDAALRELKESKRRVTELEEQLFANSQTCGSFITRKSFRTFVLVSTNRVETDLEWRHFLETFVYDEKAVKEKIYKWIEQYIIDATKIVMKV